MQPILNNAVKAVRRAASIINRAATQLDLVTVQTKSHNDFVTEVDRAAEAAIIGVVRETYPDHAILAEESGLSGGGSDHRSIIDPLHGTTSLIHDFPQYADAVAL